MTRAEKKEEEEREEKDEGGGQTEQQKLSCVANEEDVSFVLTSLLTNRALHTEAEAIPYTRRQGWRDCKLE